MKTLIKILCLSVLWISCFDVEQSLDVEGCTYSSACNYNENANLDDGSCIYAEINFDCEGNCVVEIDCLGECNGNAMLDNCNICDNNISNDCIQDECGVWGGDGTDIDLDGICDDIDDCIGDDEDLDGICDDIDECIGNLDCEGICEGNNQCYGCTDINACNFDPSANIFDNSCAYDNDDDGVCDDIDECLNDNQNDIDDDGICHNDDICPENPDNPDFDNDGTCDDEDECLEDWDDCQNCIGQPPEYVKLFDYCYRISTTTSIVRVSYGLNGELPSEIGLLTNLTVLNLSYNQISGTIPAEIGHLTNLEQLYLSHNQLSGSIPPEIGNLTNLDMLTFGNNQLTGLIPSEIGNLTNLSYLYLYDNLLSGQMPSELGNLSQIGAFNLCFNQLSGVIPEEFSNLPANGVTSWKLNNNQLSGEIPDGICSNNWNLNYNYFCPPYLDCISQQDIDTQDSSSCPPVDGCTDPEACNYNPQADIDMNDSCVDDSDNDGVCDDVDQCQGYDDSLSDCCGNCLDEEIECVELWGECYNIEETTNLNPSNQITQGQLIPPEIGQLINLTNINLYNNQLTGEIPVEIGNLTNLTYLSFYNNQLTGVIPEEICNQGDSNPNVRNNQLCPPYPECISQSDIDSQDTSNCP